MLIKMAKLIYQFQQYHPVDTHILQIFEQHYAKAYWETRNPASTLSVYQFFFI